MEGTYTTTDDLILLEAGASASDRAAETREVLNCRIALRRAIASLSEVPWSLRTIRTAHRDLLTGVSNHRGATVVPGEFKVHQNWIGSRMIETARFVPPPPREARAAIEKLELYIQREDRGGIPDLIDAALIHYQFETIHPFPDGNGRVGRMLVPLHLIMRGALKQPLLYLSPVLESRKDEYIDRMFAVSRNGDWTGWIGFFLDVVCASCARAIEMTEALLALQSDYKRRLPKAGRSANLQRIVDMLFERPVVTIPALAEKLEVAYRSAQLNVEALIRVGILHEAPGTSYPKYFIAREIRDIINQTMRP